MQRVSTREKIARTITAILMLALTGFLAWGLTAMAWQFFPRDDWNDRIVRIGGMVGIVLLTISNVLRVANYCLTGTVK